MKLFDWIELFALNVVGFSVTGWLVSFANTFSVLVAAFVGLSVVALNLVKLYGVHLDNKLKKKKLKDE